MNDAQNPPGEGLLAFCLASSDGVSHLTLAVEGIALCGLHRPDREGGWRPS